LEALIGTISIPKSMFKAFYKAILPFFRGHYPIQ